MSQRYVVLNVEEQNLREAYPQWCNLSWFHNCHGNEPGICKAHYHDFPEIWLWHSNSADGVVDGQSIKMSNGVMAYNPRGSLHSLVLSGPHSNTGIHPRRQMDDRGGHLHVEETGENPHPDMSAIILKPEENNSEHPVVLPKSAFLQHAYSGSFDEGETVFKGTIQSWLAILVREGNIVGNIAAKQINLPEPLLLIVKSKTRINLNAKTACEVAFAIGWPT